ncbi:helix-turn-helix transcriptional regulator [Streptomyces sp. UNOC14_S4]|uniref:helix-turn-helix domain-containing protein n=1 Tax=Streptomyces sp. UNOC14_S4 TaxID=2872340 RepID=UPI001E52847B|nr:helix-turn-helix transcriptional regulator [Streptomyces sp. UNOC14_S4]MCC3769117.1 helix-turn-helix domain-containing protein [Streptomyces sp. UNOC14_S4]
MSASKRLDPSQNRLIRLGMAIRTLREAKGWSQADLGKAIRLSNVSISKFETGTAFPVREVAEALDQALEADGKLLEIWDQLNDDPSAKWVQKYFAHESKAIEIHHLANSMPALLQSDEYIRTILQVGMPHYGGNLDEKVAYRHRRRAILDRPDPPLFRAVIAQSALDYVVGNADIMRGQLLHMLDMLTRANVELRMIPFAVNGLKRDLGMTQIMTFRRDRKIVYRSGPTDAGIYITNPFEIAQYTALYDQIWRDALPAHESINVIDKALEEKYPCAPSGLTCP